MNKRIRELAEQAEDFAKQDLARRRSEAQPLYQPGEYDDMIKSKFAELIIADCIAMCRTAVGNRDYNTGRLHCASDLREHFGVEE